MPDRRIASGHGAEPFQRSKRTDISCLDGRSVTVILRQRGRQYVYRGTAAFQCDDLLGNVLTVTAAGPQTGDPKLIFTEKDWKGRIIPDLEYGSELCMIPSG